MGGGVGRGQGCQAGRLLCPKFEGVPQEKHQLVLLRLDPELGRDELGVSS